MGGALIETEARTTLNQGKSQGISETKKQTALRMLKMGKLTIHNNNTNAIPGLIF